MNMESPVVSRDVVGNEASAMKQMGAGSGDPLGFRGTCR
jgi:hypothetical protein